MLFPIFSYYKQSAMNVYVYILLWKEAFTSLGLVPGSGTVGLYVRFMFKFYLLILMFLTGYFILFI